MTDIKRICGLTGVNALAPDQLKEVAFHWGWLLPRNGIFSPAELARLVRETYDVSNPRTAADVAVLENDEKEEIP